MKVRKTLLIRRSYLQLLNYVSKISNGGNVRYVRLMNWQQIRVIQFSRLSSNMIYGARIIVSRHKKIVFQLLAVI